MYYDFLGSDPDPENLTGSASATLGMGGGGLNFILCSFLLFSTDNSTGQKGGGRPCFLFVRVRAVDPHSFFADPDPAVFLNADPDPGGKMNADPDPA